MTCSCTNQNQIAVVLVLVVLPISTTRRANDIASEWSYKNQNSSYRAKFQWNFDQGEVTLVRVSEEFELSEFKSAK